VNAAPRSVQWLVRVAGLRHELQHRDLTIEVLDLCLQRGELLGEAGQSSTSSLEADL